MKNVPRPWSDGPGASQGSPTLPRGLHHHRRGSAASRLRGRSSGERARDCGHRDLARRHAAPGVGEAPNRWCTSQRCAAGRCVRDDYMRLAVADHVGRTGPQRSAWLVVGRSAGGAGHRAAGGSRRTGGLARRPRRWVDRVPRKGARRPSRYNLRCPRCRRPIHRARHVFFRCSFRSVTA